MDAEEHVKNPYKGKKLKVSGRDWGRTLEGVPLDRGCHQGPCRHLPAVIPAPLPRLPRPQALGPGQVQGTWNTVTAAASKFSSGGSQETAGLFLAAGHPMLCPVPFPLPQFPLLQHNRSVPAGGCSRDSQRWDGAVPGAGSRSTAALGGLWLCRLHAQRVLLRCLPRNTPTSPRSP